MMAPDRGCRAAGENYRYPNFHRLRPLGSRPAISRRAAARAPGSFRWPSTKAAFGRDAEIGDVSFGGRHTAPRALHPIAQVDEAEIERRVGTSLQRSKKGEISLIVTLDRHWQVDPLQRTSDRSRHAIIDLHAICGVFRLHPMPPAIAAVAEVKAKLHARRHSVDVAHQPLDHAGLDGGEPSRPHAFPKTHFTWDVPLQREIIMGNCGAYVCQICEQPARERRFNH